MSDRRRVAAAKLSASVAAGPVYDAASFSAASAVAVPRRRATGARVTTASVLRVGAGSVAAVIPLCALGAGIETLITHLVRACWPLGEGLSWCFPLTPAGVPFHTRRWPVASGQYA
ncbi:MAG: hypothetical protein KJ056_12815 [Acidimicrobiia bacterium]|nr:hypothetical protein [Acidimicrobiia bacterium]